MRKKVLWIFLTLLTVVAMILVSCKTETTTEEPTVITGTVKLTLPPAVEKPVVSHSEKPQHGGIYTSVLTADILTFDEAVAQNHTLAISLWKTNEELLQNDWSKGPAGTGEFNFLLGGVNNFSNKTGSLADSWEIPQKGKMVFHIREGVKWQNKPPTSGRALTVDDVVFSLQRMCTAPASYIKLGYSNLAKTAVITGDEATRTVTIECPVSEWANSVTIFPDFCTIMPRDAVEKYGNMGDWRNSIGTGPFLLIDFVSNGSAIYKRNPDYWGTNPVGPGKGDQLPYLEGIKQLVIPDIATRITAFRTSKIDLTGATDLYYDDVKEFLENPDIKSIQYTSDSGYAMGMRTDMADSPFSKKEVRQALFYATDFNKIKNDFYDSKAVILNWPLCYVKENAAAYIAMEQLPVNVQALFSHNVTKAKELLSAAGYPTLNISVICYNTASQTDFLSLIKNMWAEAGINLTIDAKDYANWTTRTKARNYGANELLYATYSGAWQKMINFNGTSQYNLSYVNDPTAAEAAAKAADYIGLEEDKLAKVNADLMPYVIEQCWTISKPSPYIYVLWWPWVKNFNGELYNGYYNICPEKYLWMDLTLRKQMTGQ